MKTQTILFIITLACMLAVGQPARGQTHLDLTAELVNRDIPIGSELRPYSFEILPPYDEIGAVGPYVYRKPEEVRRRGANVEKGLGIGLGIGALGGGVIGALRWTECNEEGFMACFMHPESRGKAFITGAAIGAGLGGFFGLLIGAASEKNNRVKPPVKVRLGMSPIPSERTSVSPSVSVNLRLKSKR